MAGVTESSGGVEFCRFKVLCEDELMSRVRHTPRRVTCRRLCTGGSPRGSERPICGGQNSSVPRGRSGGGGAGVGFRERRFRQLGLYTAFYEAAPAVKHNVAIVVVDARTHVSSKTPIGCCGAGAVAWARLRSSIPGQKRTASSPAGLASSAILLFALFEETGSGPSAHERSRGVVGRSLCCGRPTVGQGGTRAPTTSWSLDETSGIPIASILCGCPLRRGEWGRRRVAA
jgi:hypothetical protein